MNAATAVRLIENVKDDSIRATIALAWVTASRIDDVLRATVHTTEEPETLLILFRRTKTNQQQDPREDHQVLIQRTTMPKQLWRRIETWRPKAPDSIKRQLVTILAATDTDDIPVTISASSRRRHFTLHSLKRGAVTELMLGAANGSISPDLVSVIAKHKRNTPTIQPTTIGYTDRPDLVAKALRTDVATTMLQHALWPPMQ